MTNSFLFRTIAGAAIVASPFVAASVAHADTDTQSATIDLSDNINASGDGTLPGFDSALGTLTQVDISMSVSADMALCIENTNPEAGAEGAGVGSASLELTGPSGVMLADTTDVTDSADLDPSNGEMDCEAAWDFGAARFGSTPTSGDVMFISEQASLTDSQSITDNEALQAFVDQQVPFSYAGTSNGDASLASDWDIWFVAEGLGQIEVTYTFEPNETPSTTAPPTSAPASTVPSTSVPVTESTHPEPTTTQPGQLPVTGSDSQHPILLAGLLVIAGGSALFLSRRSLADER